VRVRAHTYTRTTPQTRDIYKAKGDQKAESIEHSYVCLGERERESEREREREREREQHVGNDIAI
jgi:hypothetical protein